MRVVVLVPRRADHGRRDELWAWVKARWEREHPIFDVFEGHHIGGGFNRSAAVNDAALQAGDWDVAIIADSDSFVSVDQLFQAVVKCATTGKMVLAYDTFAYLSRAMTDKVMTGFLGDWWSGVEWSMPGTCSSMVLVTRKVWDECEGFDEAFIGWGGEDIAFSLKAQTFGDGLERVPGAVWHLHHPPAVRNKVETWVPRIEEYAAASYDRFKMRALMDRYNNERTSA